MRILRNKEPAHGLSVAAPGNNALLKDRSETHSSQNKHALKTERPHPCRPARLFALRRLRYVKDGLEINLHAGNVWDAGSEVNDLIGAPLSPLMGTSTDTMSSVSLLGQAGLDGFAGRAIAPQLAAAYFAASTSAIL